MGFLGSKTEPFILRDEEVEHLTKQIKEGKIRPKIMFDTGDKVRIKEGPFVNFTGTIEDIYSDKGRLRVLIVIFGRMTPVELEFSQVEKIS